MNKEINIGDMRWLDTYLWEVMEILEKVICVRRWWPDGASDPHVLWIDKETWEQQAKEER